jgi:hypothetical protein
MKGSDLVSFNEENMGKFKTKQTKRKDLKRAVEDNVE